MSDVWKEASLGDLCSFEYGKALPQRDRSGEGFPVVGSAGIVGYHSDSLIKGPAVVVGRKGSAGAVVRVEADCWPIDTTYWISPKKGVDLGYLSYLLEFLDLPSLTITTAIPGLNRDHAAALRCAVPSPSEQLRIADLLTSVDVQFDRTHRETDALLAVRDGLLADRVERLTAEAPPATLGDIASVTSGISWKKTDEVEPDAPGAMGVMGVSNVQRDHAHARDCVWIPATTQAMQKAIAAHTILTIRTNGNADRIGNMHLAPEEAVGYTISSFLTSITTNDPGDAPYLLRVLQSPQLQTKITAATSGSTGLKNLAVSWLRAVEVPWADEAERARLVAEADAVEETVRAARSFAEATKTLRTRMLSDLLSGELRIPETYDRFLASRAKAPSEDPDLVSA